MADFLTDVMLYSLISESETHIIWIHYTYNECFKNVFFWNINDYWPQIMGAKKSEY